MKPPPAHGWKPEPQLLAAYFDGEMDDRAELAALRCRLEAWLEQHPEAYAADEAQRRLRIIWQETAPAEPSNASWRQVLARIDEARRKPHPPAHSRSPWLRAGAGAVAAALLCGMLLGALWFTRAARLADAPDVALHQEKVKRNVADDMDVLPVASMSEVRILRVEGEDTGSLVVGELPLHGPLELAAPGEIRFVRVHPDAQDMMLPQVRQDGQNRPIIWARIDTEDD